MRTACGTQAGTSRNSGGRPMRTNKRKEPKPRNLEEPRGATAREESKPKEPRGTGRASDDDQLFYLKTRGFNEPEARDVLVAAFLNATLTDMGSDSVHEHLLQILTRDLAADLGI